VRWDILDAFRAAASEAGIKPIPDFNTGDNEGSCVFHVNQKRGRRWSAARGFLKPVLGRPNLRLETQCLVEGIVFDGKRAAGDVAGARDASRKAGLWAMWSALAAPILLALWFLLFGGLAILGSVLEH
jgi:choline dehydrogenase-like flavoprotein